MQEGHLETAFSLMSGPLSGCPASGEHWLFFSPGRLIHPRTDLGPGGGGGFQEMAAPSLCSAVKGETAMLSWPHKTRIISKLPFDESHKGLGGHVRGTWGTLEIPGRLREEVTLNLRTRG